MRPRLLDIGVYAVSVIAILGGLVLSVNLSMLLWLHAGGLGGLALIFGIPILVPDLPLGVHVLNIIAAMWPGVIVGWLVLKLLGKRDPRLAVALLGLVWVAALAALLGWVSAQSRVIDGHIMFYAGFVGAAVLGYFWTDRLVCRKPLIGAAP